MQRCNYFGWNRHLEIAADYLLPHPLAFYLHGDWFNFSQTPRGYRGL